MSVWRQTSARRDSKPLGLPSLSGEFANSAVDTGEAASASVRDAYRKQQASRAATAAK